MSLRARVTGGAKVRVRPRAKAVRFRKRFRLARDGVHFFSISVRAAKPAGARGKRAARAVVQCWIRFPLPDGALAVARHYLQADGWRVRAVDEHRWIESAAGLGAEDEHCFREAQADGSCMVYQVDS